MIWKLLLELATPIVVHNISKKFIKDDSEFKENDTKFKEHLKKHIKELEGRIQTLEKKVRALQIYSLISGILFSIGFIIFIILYLF